MSSWDNYETKTATIGDNLKGVLDSQCRDLSAAQSEVDRLEAELKLAKARVRNIAMEIIPKTFEDMGLDDSTKLVVDGNEISIRSDISARPKAADRELVYNWLEEHGHGGIIKRKAVFTVGRDNEAKAKAWIKKIKAFPGLYERKVEPMTLKAFVKEQLAAGNDIPMDLFGAEHIRIAKVKSED